MKFHATIEHIRNLLPKIEEKLGTSYIIHVAEKILETDNPKQEDIDFIYDRLKEKLKNQDEE